MNTLPPDIAALIDPKPEEEVRTAYSAAHARIAELQKQLADADIALAAANAARGELMRKSVTGETVSPKEIREADHKISEVETQRRFIADTLGGLQDSLPQLDRAIAAARGESYRGVFREGVRRRFVAGAKVGAAQVALRAAESELAAASEILQFAMIAGLRVPADAVEALRKPMPSAAEKAILMRDDFFPAEAL